MPIWCELNILQKPAIHQIHRWKYPTGGDKPLPYNYFVGAGFIPARVIRILQEAPKFKIDSGGRAEIPNSEFRIPNSKY